MSRRWVPVGLVACLLLSACAATESDDPSSAAVPVVLEAVVGSAREDVPSALDRIDDPALPPPLVDPTRVIAGGPPPDGIPPIDEPRFEPAAGVDWLTGDEPVLVPAIGRPARAYPVRILIWHEIVNDTIDGRPVVVTYCPLCNSALGFDRRLGDRVLTFGTSGSLYLSDLVMYDRQTESLFSQIEGRAIAGVLAGAELDRVPVQTVTWAQFRDAHPDCFVLSRETGADRDYGRNPYPGYDDPTAQPFLFDGTPDPRLPPKERVVALVVDNDPVAVPLAELTATGVIELDVAGRSVVVWSIPGLRSALDAAQIAEGSTIGATGAFDPVLDGRALHFARHGDGFTDAETASRWNVLGQAVAGQLTAAQLTPVDHLDTFWFAWAAVHPETPDRRARVTSGSMDHRTGSGPAGRWPARANSRWCRMRWIVVGRWPLLIAMAAAAAAIAVWSPTLDTAGLQSTAARWGVWAPLVFAGAYVAATLLVVPKNVLTIGAGLVFGFGVGSALVWVAAMAGAAAAFWLGRFLGLDVVRRLAGPRQDRFAELAARRGGVAVLVARLVPIVPFTVVNYGSGAAGVGALPYLIATAVGIIPGTLVYAAIGAFGSAPTSWPFVLAAAVLVAGTLAAGVAGFQRRRKRPTVRVGSGR